MEWVQRSEQERRWARISFTDQDFLSCLNCKRASSIRWLTDIIRSVVSSSNWRYFSISKAVAFISTLRIQRLVLWAIRLFAISAPVSLHPQEILFHAVATH